MLLNAFSLKMVSEFPADIRVSELTIDQARTALLLESEAMGEVDLVISAVGHADTAAVFSCVLGMTVPMNRATVTLKKGDSAVVGQYSGPRLAEGAMTLPEGATIKWLLVSIS